ncbi:hydrolase [Streptomyces albireticuli]|uniref:Hydrolase n=1 Tax=Streptomyces albireticuli TaxID=1940 RepID=A0A1Z2L7R7_9ACTN|nr:MBL fold metallo-hydrolase [Streptomyces albireticuli]ARZ70356.1 hydrolase [Streptomyces albireticuli]
MTDHGGGVWSVPVPIPGNPLGHTLVHLLDTGRGPVLVDTGWDDPASWDALTAGLAACGTSVAALHGVLVTHHHPDHHGLSGRVREASGAWIAMHPADTELVRHLRGTPPGGWIDLLAGKLTAAGAPAGHVARLEAARAAARELPGRRAALPDRELVHGELLDLPGRRLRAVWTPGHTPGHVCLHLEEAHPHGGAGNGRLFSGDHLLPGITPHVGLYEIYEPARAPGEGPADPLGDYLSSLARVAALDPAEVLPAHQHAFTDAPGRVRELLAHHRARLAELRALLGTPRTLWQLTASMAWNRPWDRIPYASRNIAVAEAEAHLRHLVARRQAEAVPGSHPVAYVAV